MNEKERRLKHPERVIKLIKRVIELIASLRHDIAGADVICGVCPFYETSVGCKVEEYPLPCAELEGLLGDLQERLEGHHERRQG